jgi:hypothetical protein
MREGFVYDAGGAARLKRRMIERVLTRCEDADLGEVRPLMTLFRRLASEAAAKRLACFAKSWRARPLRWTLSLFGMTPSKRLRPLVIKLLPENSLIEAVAWVE